MPTYRLVVEHRAGSGRFAMDVVVPLANLTGPESLGDEIDAPVRAEMVRRGYPDNGCIVWSINEIAARP